MGVYIKAFNAISPAALFDTKAGQLSAPIPENGALHCIEPVYKEFIAPKLLRRMSRAVKMGVTCAIENLKQVGIEQPDAILTATGLGCVADTVKFLDQMTINKEALMNPTPFIQSTHNTVSGQIALLLQCRNYNLTFTQNRFSFESAMLEAIMMLEENPGQNILVGGADELTADSHALMQKAGCAIDEENKSGFIVGEGAAFFTLTGEKGKEDGIEIIDLKLITSCQKDEDLMSLVSACLEQKGLTPLDINILLTGESDAYSAKKYLPVVKDERFQQVNHISFKNYCGEYDTATSFALWQACHVLNDAMKPAGKNRFALIINHDKEAGYALYLLKR